MKYSLYALLGFAVVCLFVFMFVVSFLLYFTGPNADSQHLQYFGQVGDFFGGMLNPVLAFASFIALLYTIRIQSEELRLSTEELKKSASAAEKSALLEERNVEQQKTNIERQFEIAKYQEWMGMARDKLNKINSFVFDDYTILSDDGSGGENPLRKEHVPSIRNWFEWTLQSMNPKLGSTEECPLTLDAIQSHITGPWLGYKSKEPKLLTLRRELVLLGRILRDLEKISESDVVHIRSDLQFAVGVLLCTGLILYRDETLTSINSDKGCPFEGFLAGYSIKHDPLKIAYPAPDTER